MEFDFGRRKGEPRWAQGSAGAQIIAVLKQIEAGWKVEDVVGSAGFPSTRFTSKYDEWISSNRRKSNKSIRICCNR